MGYLTKIRSKILLAYSNITGVTTLENIQIPKEGADLLPDYIQALYDDANKWKMTSFKDRIEGINDPKVAFEKFRLLEKNFHWLVYGGRKTPDKSWKTEMVDEEIQNQIRLVKTYLTANFHDILISPNIANINEIYDEFRKKFGWAKFINEYVGKALIEGTAIHKSLMDSDIVLRNEEVFPSPHSTGIESEKGCWYLIEASQKTFQQIKSDYPDIDKKLLVGISNSTKNKSLDPRKIDYQHTKTIDEIAVFFDDPQLIPIVVKSENIDLENEAVKNGIRIFVQETDDHKQHLEQHYLYIEELAQEMQNDPATQLTPEILQNITIGMSEHIESHLEKIKLKVEENIPLGMCKKYPYGRYVVLIGGTLIARDEENPYKIPWREIYDRYVNEEIADSFWGRGIAETLYKTNYDLDLQLSRLSDSSFTISQPKLYFDISDMDSIEEQGINNNPDEPGFVSKPPFIVQASGARELSELYQYRKASAQKSRGVSDVSYGQTPTSEASGKLVEMLRQANNVIITGESNQNLNDVLESIVETRLKIWKNFFKRPRIIFIKGVPRTINLSRLLTEFEYQGTIYPIEDFQINIRPFSNFPYNWEAEVQLFMELTQTSPAGGAPLAPKEALLEVLARRYPELAVGGKFYQMDQAMEIGLQVMAQQQAKQEADQKIAKKFEGKMQNEGLKKLTGA